MTDSWYGEGLRFSCTRCGNCCTGEPGNVRVSRSEVEVLASFCGLDPEPFLAVYTRTLKSGARVLRERADGACVFWDARAGCTVYEHRPRQCRTWPFWRAVVASQGHWDQAAKNCPGMNHGAWHPASTIRRLSVADGTSGTIPDLAGVKTAADSPAGKKVRERTTC